MSIRLHPQGKKWLSIKLDPPVNVPLSVMMLKIKIIFRHYSQNSELPAVRIHRLRIYKNKQLRQRSVGVQITLKQKSWAGSYFVNVNGIPATVCKLAFVNIHCISKACIDKVQNNMAISSVPSTGRRDRNGSRSQVSSDKL